MHTTHRRVPAHADRPRGLETISPRTIIRCSSFDIPFMMLLLRYPYSSLPFRADDPVRLSHSPQQRSLHAPLIPIRSPLEHRFHLPSTVLAVLHSDFLSTNTPDDSLPCSVQLALLCSAIHPLIFVHRSKLPHHADSPPTQKHK